jgi:hypothetical protein
LIRLRLFPKKTEGEIAMKLTRVEGKGILLTPHTATEECFLCYLAELIEAKEREFLRNHALELEALAQDSPPSESFRRS